MSRSNLSFKKFLEILSKHSIEIQRVFSRGNEVIFLYVKHETREFFITIPEQYKMLFQKDVPHIHIDYAESANDITENFVQLLCAKLDSDLAIVSNNYIFDTQNRSFKITGKTIIHHSEIGIVDLLEKKSHEILRETSIKFEDTIPPPRENTSLDFRSSGEEYLSSPTKEYENGDEEYSHEGYSHEEKYSRSDEEYSSHEPTEFNFLDINGHNIPLDTNYASLVSDYDSEPEIVEETTGNNIDWDLKDYPLKIGKIFKIIPITDFFEEEGVERVCSDVFVFAEELYHAEIELRKEKFDTIQDLCEKLYKMYQDSFDYFENLENKLVRDKKRLQNIISSLTFRTNVDAHKKDEIIDKANIEINNIDLKLLKCRDEYNEYFDKCISFYEKEMTSFRLPDRK